MSEPQNQDWAPDVCQDGVEECKFLYVWPNSRNFFPPESYLYISLQSKFTSYLDAGPLGLMLQSVWTELAFTVHLFALSKLWRLSKGLPLVHALWSTSAGERNTATNSNKSGQSPSFDILYICLCVKRVYSLITINHLGPFIPLLQSYMMFLLQIRQYVIIICHIRWWIKSESSENL